MAQVMSAYIVSKSDDAFHLFTDGGVFANDGTLYAKTQKTYMLAHMPAAMTVIGSRAWGLILYPDLCMCHTLDHFLDNAKERLRNYLPTVTTVVEKERSTTEFAPIIAGYSERHDRMVCFVIGNHQKSELSKPWKLREITDTHRAQMA
jgi:hypothetical protein